MQAQAKQVTTIRWIKTTLMRKAVTGATDIPVAVNFPSAALSTLMDMPSTSTGRVMPSGLVPHSPPSNEEEETSDAGHT